MRLIASGCADVQQRRSTQPWSQGRYSMHYLVLLAAILGQEPDQPKGHLVIAGGGATIPEITEKALALSGGKKAHVLIIPQASSVTGGGTSAGAAVMSLIMLIGENDLGRVTDDAVRTAEGLGLWPDVIIDQHYLRRLRFNRLLSA